MGRKEKKYHYIYKTTNVINSKYYIGMHSTDNLDDGYMGSGKRLRNSINYHGKDNFIKEILEYCDSRGELKEREREIVNKELLNEDLCMNLVVGGEGGGRFYSKEHQKKCSEAGNKAFKERYENDLELREKFKEHISKISKNNWNDEKLRERMIKNIDRSGKKHSDETKQKMSESSKGQGSGSSNSQYGKCWITNEVDNKKIKRGDLIPEGWRLGRKMK